MGTLATAPGLLLTDDPSEVTRRRCRGRDQGKTAASGPPHMLVEKQNGQEHEFGHNSLGWDSAQQYPDSGTVGKWPYLPGLSILFHKTRRV